MGYESGKLAYVNGVSCVQSWGISENVSSERYAASCTNGGTNTVVGNSDWVGTISGVGNPHTRVIPGNQFTFDGVAESGLHYQGMALTEELTVNFPKAAGGVVNWSATFGLLGDLTKAVDASPSDSTFASALGAADFSFELDDVVVAGIQAATLTMRMPHSTYVDGGFTYRRANNLELDFSIDVKETDLEVAETSKGANGRGEIIINSDYQWDIDYLVCLSRTNFLVDRQTGDIIGYTVNYQWSAVQDVGGTPTEGYILHPDGTTYLFGDAPAP